MKTVRTTYTCDRCGGDAGCTCNGDEPSPEAYLMLGVYGTGDPSKSKLKDLCRNCYDALERWVSEMHIGGKE